MPCARRAKLSEGFSEELYKYTCKYKCFCYFESMPHLNIYVDEPAGRLIARAAKRDSLSLSRWAREKLLAAAGAPEWPAGYRELLGSIDDDSFVVPAEDAAARDQMARFE